MPTVLDIEQALLLLELEPPFDKRGGAARAAPAGEGLAPRSRASGQAGRPRAAPEGDQRGGGRARAHRGDLARRDGQPQRGEGQRRGGAQGARGGGPPRLRGRAAPPRGGDRPRDARPVRLADARPLGRAPLRPLPLLPGVGGRRGRRHLLHRRRRRHPAVGARALPARHPHRSGRLAAVRRLQQARPGGRARPALRDRGPARARRGRLRARRPAPHLRARRRPPQRRRSCGS